MRWQFRRLDDLSGQSGFTGLTWTGEHLQKTAFFLEPFQQFVMERLARHTIYSIQRLGQIFLEWLRSATGIGRSEAQAEKTAGTEPERNAAAEPQTEASR